MWDKIKRILSRVNLGFFLIIMILTCGCQSTPEEEAVVYGGDLEEKIAGTPAPMGTYDAPGNWQETLEMKGSDTKVEIDAAIRVPDVTTFPVYKVRKAEFDDTIIAPLVKHFTKGREGIKYTEPTKADLERLLILAKKNNDEESQTEYAKMMETAPDTVETEKITNWSVDQETAGCFADEDGEYAGIGVGPDSFIYMNGYIETESVALLNDKDIREVTLSKENAIIAAQNTLQELGINYMVADSLEKAQSYACMSTSKYADYSENPVSKGYLIKFARNVDGIAAIIDSRVSFNVADEFDYKAPLYPEEIQIYVDETGKVQSFVWSEPLKIEEKLSENVSLLPFEEVKQRIRDMLTFMNSYNSDPTIVTSIEMHMTIIDVKDHPDEAMYVPAWFIHYTKTFYDPETDDDIKQEYKLVLNAIDGGRVLELPTDLTPEMQQQMEQDS